ncbi:Hypothetical predicted protein, partial [Mytilus galloprovincialis]
TRGYGYKERDETVADIVSFLIQNGAYIVKNKDGNGPIHLAAKNGYLATIKVLLQLDKDSIFDNNKAGDTAIHICLKNRKVLDIAEGLLKSGADPKFGYCLQHSLQNCRSNYRNTDSCTAFIHSLLQKGADPNKHKTNGSNLIDCVQDQNSCLVEEIIKYGGDVNFADGMKKTALHYACIRGQFKDRHEITALLVKHRSNLNATSVNGERPLDVLVQNMIKNIRNLDVKEAQKEQCGLLTIDLSLLNLLICGGADLCPSMIDTIDSKNEELSTGTMQIQVQNTSQSALFMLISNGLFKTAEYLLHSGWDVEKEEWFDAFDVSKLELENVTVDYNIHKRYEIETRKAEFQSFLESIDTGPKSLANICRKTIRHQLLTVSNDSEIEIKISALPPPPKIKCFLSLKEFMNHVETIEIEKMVSGSVSRYDSDDYYDDSDSDDDYYYGCYYDSSDIDFYYDSDR